MSENIRFRTYKTSINIIFFTYYNNSKVYEIPQGKSTILPGLKYSLLTLMFGFLGIGLPWTIIQNIKHSLNALHVNFTGGEDYTKVFSEMDYDEITIWVFNNLERALFEKTNLEIIDIIIDLQSEYIQSNPKSTLEKNIQFIAENLKKVNIINLRNSDLEVIIDKIKQFENRNE